MRITTPRRAALVPRSNRPALKVTLTRAALTLHVLPGAAAASAAAQAADQSAEDAAASAAAALVSENNAAASAAAALVSENNAAASELGAEAAQLAAENAQTAAENAQSASEDARDLAQEWAENPEDDAITGHPGSFSALHYAAKAESEKIAAAQAKTDAEAAELAAQGYAGAASGSAGDALGYANAASGHADDAEAAKIAAEAAAASVDLPIIVPGDAGKVLTVNVAEDGYELETPSGGGGAVDSVNGQTGVVVLDHTDVGAASAAQGALADTAVQPADLATVATTGDYDDLTNRPDAGAGFRNLLLNPAGLFNQRGASSIGDDVYGHDRWYALTQTASIAVSTLTDVENGMPRMWRLSQSQATAQRMGYAQIVEGQNCKFLRGRSVTLSGRIRCSSSQAIRYAILEWTGTEDTVTSDVVNSWTNGTFTAGQFFLGSNLTVATVGSITPPAATVTNLTPLTVTLSSSLNNLIVFIWTEGAAAQNVTLDGGLQIEAGAVATEFQNRPVSVELAMLQRYYEKSYGIEVAPGTTTFDGTMSAFGLVSGSGGTARLTAGVEWSFGVAKRSTPIVTTYSPNSGSSGRGYDLSSDFATETASVNTTRTIVRPTNATSVVVGTRYVYHIVAEVEL